MLYSCISASCKGSKHMDYCSIGPDRTVLYRLVLVSSICIACGGGSRRRYRALRFVRTYVIWTWLGFLVAGWRQFLETCLAYQIRSRCSSSTILVFKTFVPAVRAFADETIRTVHAPCTNPQQSTNQVRTSIRQRTLSPDYHWRH